MGRVGYDLRPFAPSEAVALPTGVVGCRPSVPRECRFSAAAARLQEAFNPAGDTDARPGGRGSLTGASRALGHRGRRPIQAGESTSRTSSTASRHVAPHPTTIDPPGAAPGHGGHRGHARRGRGRRRGGAMARPGPPVAVDWPWNPCRQPRGHPARGACVLHRPARIAGPAFSWAAHPQGAVPAMVRSRRGPGARRPAPSPRHRRSSPSGFDGALRWWDDRRHGAVRRRAVGESYRGLVICRLDL